MKRTPIMELLNPPTAAGRQTAITFEALFRGVV
jgi:hypothetical protein